MVRAKRSIKIWGVTLLVEYQLDGEVKAPAYDFDTEILDVYISGAGSPVKISELIDNLNGAMGIPAIVELNAKLRETLIESAGV